MNKLKFTNLIFIFLLVSLLIELKWLTFENISIQNLKISILFSVIIFLVCIINWIKIKKNFISAYSFFLICFFLFMFGQDVLYLLDIDYNGLNIYDLNYSTELLFKSNIFCTISMLFIHAGVLFSRKFKFIFFSKKRIFFKTINKKSYYYTGLFLLIISILPHLLYMVDVIRVGIGMGYTFLYKEQIGSSLNIFEGFFYISLFLLAIGIKNIKIKKFLTLFPLIDVVIYLIAGSRGNAIPILFAIILFYNQNIKKIESREKYKIIVVMLLVTIFVPVISIYRVDKSTTFLDLVKSFLLGDNSIISQLFGEMGGSKYTLIECMKLIPSKIDYMNGVTYLGSIIDCIFPSFIVSSQKLGITVWLGSWLQDILNLSYGPGFAITSEVYVNFGYYGLGLFLFLGIIIYNFLEKENKIHNFRNVCSPILFIYLSTYIRGQSIDTFTKIFIYLIIPFLILKLIDLLVKKD